MSNKNTDLPLIENKIGETTWLTNKTILKPLLNKHMAPKGKIGLVVVKVGSIDFVWEDDLKNVLTCDKDNPIVIESERYHHLILKGDVEFKIEFYKEVESKSSDELAKRPGESFITKY